MSTDAPLHRRLAQVLRGMADGKTHAEIAQDLGLSLNTVRSYVAILYARLGARNRAHAVNIAYQRGILTRNEPPSS